LTQSAKSGLERERQRTLVRGLYPALGVLALITAAPALFLVIASLTPLTPTRPESWVDFSDPLRNYREAFADARFLQSVVVQLKLSISTVSAQLVLGLGLALLVNAHGRALEFVRSALIIPMVLPPIVVGILWKILYVPETSPIQRALEMFGLSLGSPITDPDRALAAIVVAETWEWFPFTLIMCFATLRTLPAEHVESACVDGADVWQMFRFVTLPWLRRTLTVVAMFRLIDSVKAFPLIYVLTEGGPGTVTEVTNYYAFVQAFNFSYWGYASAIATMLVSGVVLLSWIVERIGRQDTAREPMS
jgi:multiple sugar transport system permease protein